MERIDVRKLGGEKTGFRWSEPPESLGLGAEDGFSSPIEIEVTARRIGTGEEVMVEGSLSGRVRAECVRCLEGTERDVRAEVAIEYREGHPPEGKDESVGNGETDMGWYRPPFIDLADDLRQVLLLEVPSYPVCREDCRGLCPGCGANLNSGPCSCGNGSGKGATREAGAAPKIRRKKDG